HQQYFGFEIDTYDLADTRRQACVVFSKEELRVDQLPTGEVFSDCGLEFAGRPAVHIVPAGPRRCTYGSSRSTRARTSPRVACPGRRANRRMGRVTSWQANREHVFRDLAPLLRLSGSCCAAVPLR